MGDDTVARLARSLARYQALVVAGLCFIVVLAVTIMGIMLYLSFSLGAQREKLASVAVETHTALCALRNDMEVRRTASIKLLKEHPGEEFIFSIPRSYVESGVANQTAALNALEVLKCKE